MAGNPNDAKPFLIARGGPFYDLQRKAKLVGAKDLNPVGRRRRQGFGR